MKRTGSWFLALGIVFLMGWWTGMVLSLPVDPRPVKIVRFL